MKQFKILWGLFVILSVIGLLAMTVSLVIAIMPDYKALSYLIIVVVVFVLLGIHIHLKNNPLPIRQLNAINKTDDPDKIIKFSEKALQFYVNHPKHVTRTHKHTILWHIADAHKQKGGITTRLIRIAMSSETHLLKMTT